MAGLASGSLAARWRASAIPGVARTGKRWDGCALTLRQTMKNADVLGSNTFFLRWVGGSRGLFANLTGSPEFRGHNFVSGAVSPVPDPFWDVRTWFGLSPGVIMPDCGYDVAAMLRFTLSQACCEAFLRKAAACPFSASDYYVSKLLQFLAAPLSIGIDDAYVGEANCEIGRLLDEALLTIDPDALFQLEALDWERMRSDFAAGMCFQLAANVLQYLPQSSSTEGLKPLPATKPRLFPVPDNWAQVDIVFLSDHAVRILINGTEHGPYSYAALGFYDRRTTKPVGAWIMLVEIAHKGEVLRAFVHASTIESYVKDLRNRLKALFGLGAQPIKLHIVRGDRIYMPNFRASFPDREHR